MYKIFEQYIVFGPMDHFGNAEPIDVGYDHVYSSNDERATLEEAKRIATELKEFYPEEYEVEVVSLDNPVKGSTAADNLYRSVVTGAVHIKRDGTPIHSLFIEYFAP